MGEIRQILKKTKILFVFKGYTCHFKSEAFASIALRPCYIPYTFIHTMYMMLEISPFSMMNIQCV